MTEPGVNESELVNKVQETAAAAAGAEPLPKGNKLEKAILSAEEVAEDWKQPKPEAGKRGRGRPRKHPKPENGQTKTNIPPVQSAQPNRPKADPILAIVNSMACPGLAMALKKNVRDIQITAEQAELLATVMPEGDALTKPSWWWYSILTVCMLINNTIQARSTKPGAGSVVIMKAEKA